MDSSNIHQPVLLDAVLAHLSPKKGESYLDLTAGYGGHATRILAVTQAPEKSVLVDRDENAIAHLRGLPINPLPRLLYESFADAAEKMQKEGLLFDMILLDIGVSSPHLDNANRGFSFRTEAPLDMRMDQRQDLTADMIVNNWSESQLADLIFRYGEEPGSRRIAREIIASRPIHTTLELASVIARVIPHMGKIHPATRTFQALRIAVNDELGQLAAALPRCIDLLAPSGRIAVISFHSLEDRIVKQFFVEHSGKRFDAEMVLLTKKPVTGSAQEIAFNPRARSAKLRAAAKK